MSSHLFPHKTNPKIPQYDYDFAIELMQQVGAKAKEFGHRLTFHPGQYNVVGSPNDKVVKSTEALFTLSRKCFNLYGNGKRFSNGSSWRRCIW